MLVSGIGMFKADSNRQIEGRRGGIGMQSSSIMNEGYNTDDKVEMSMDTANVQKSDTKQSFLSRIINNLISRA